jgi:hypothetical protein
MLIIYYALIIIDVDIHIFIYCLLCLIVLNCGYLVDDAVYCGQFCDYEIDYYFLYSI